MGGLLEELEKPAHAAKKQRHERWSLAYDNAGVHCEAATKLKIRGRHPHPAKSPDLQMVVEHVHSWLTQKMQSWLSKQRDVAVTPAAAKAELERVFKQYPLRSLARDVASLKDTYKAVIAVQGAYPAKRFR